LGEKTDAKFKAMVWNFVDNLYQNGESVLAAYIKASKKFGFPSKQAVSQRYDDLDELSREVSE